MYQVWNIELYIHSYTTVDDTMNAPNKLEWYRAISLSAQFSGMAKLLLYQV